MATVVVAILAWFGWNQHEKSQEAERTASVAAQVKELMQAKFDTDTSLQRFHVQVLDVDLIKQTDRTFVGQATVQTPRTSWQKIAIDVTASDSQIYWRAEPGAYAFLVQESLPSTGYGQ